MTDSQQKQVLPDSTFHMLRCVTALVHADDVVKKEEREFLKTLIKYFEGNFTITDAHKFQLMQDLQSGPEIEQLLPLVTDKKDLENLVLFAGMLAKADGELHPEEEAVLKKIQAHKEAHVPTAAAVPAQVIHAPPVVDIDLLAAEVRQIVKQEFYRQGIEKSGIVPKSSALSVADAFVERGSLIHPDVFDAMTEKHAPSKSTRRTLMQEEKTLSRAKFHPFYVFEGFVYAALIFWFTGITTEWTYKGLASMQSLMHFNPEVLNPVYWNRIFMFDSWLTSGIFFSYWLLKWWATEIILTDRRLLYKRGILFVTYTKIDLRQLFETVVNQSRLGAILNYGSVFIYSNMVDTSIKGDKYDRNIVFPKIYDPHAFASRVDRAKRMLRARGD